MRYPKQEGRDREAETLLLDEAQEAQDTEAVHPPAKSCRQFAQWRRTVKVGGLLAFAAALFTSTFVLIPRYFWSSFKDFGPEERQDYPLPVSSRFRF